MAAAGAMLLPAEAAPLHDEAAAWEAAVCARAARRVQELLVGAAREVCPDIVAVWDLPRDAVRLCASPSGGADLECRAPRTAWRKLVARARGAPVVIATVSEYGLRREATYEGAGDFARAIVARLADESREVLADVRVAEDGSLLLTSQLHMRRQRACGLLHCSACGGFFAGRRGLRDHQQVKHRSTYEEATEAVHAARGALMAYERGAEEASLARLWEARAADAEAGRQALPAGLAAARDGDLGALRALAAAGWDARGAADRHGSTAMMWAAGSGHLAACELLLGLGASPRAAQPKDGRTPMHWAARNGRLAVCRWLVAQGCAADPRTHDGTTPLHWAVWQGHLPVCRWLVEGGLADVTTRNAYGCNAVQWAAQSDGDDVAMCRWLLDARCDLTLLNHNGHSALHKAAIKGRGAVCEWLLSPAVGLGAAHLRADGDGNTPSRMARAEGFAELAAWLEAAEEARGPELGAGSTLPGPGQRSCDQTQPELAVAAGPGGGPLQHVIDPSSPVTT